MPALAHSYVIAVMSLILAFSLIDLGVVIGFIARFSSYGSIFQPQMGICGFNFVIGLFGVAVGITGFVSIRINTKPMIRTVCIMSFIFGILALCSLIAAIVLNAKSANYISTQLSNDMVNYQTDDAAGSFIDQLQTSHACCGVDMWLDWARIQLNDTIYPPSVAPSNNPATNTNDTSTGSMNNTDLPDASITVLPLASTSGPPVANISNQTDGSITGLPVANTSNQTYGSMPYGVISNLPLSFTVVLPNSCCTPDANFLVDYSYVDYSSETFCVSNSNDTSNSFYTQGCAKQLIDDAGNQSMGVGVINSFMIVLAFIAIPILIDDLEDSI